MNLPALISTACGAIYLFGAGITANAASPAASASPDARASRVIDHWTAERRRNAMPRDLVVDREGRGYLRLPNGSLVPWGTAGAHVPDTPVLKVGPGSGGGGNVETTPPSISNLDPVDGMVLGSSYTFYATVTDDSGIKSVTFNLQKSGASVQSYAASAVGGDVFRADISNLTTGDWTWWVVATDTARRGGNSATSDTMAFSVDAGPPPGGGGTDTVTDANWTGGGAVQTAAGRIYFEMPANPKRKGIWNGYVCSGTVVTDNVSGRSVILTAAHCVYDDANKAFARNVLFIPDQAHTSGSGTDLNCSNDPLGCWAPSFGMVDVNWTTRTFPDNIPWDYAFYVVNDTAAHSGTSAGSSALDAAAGHLGVSFTTPLFDDGAGGATSPDFTHALGYSYSRDPQFRYCAEDMTTEGADNWWLPSCLLSGGSSGGPWIQPMSSQGDGPVISVNSWGYTNSPGMAGPRLSGTSAECVYTVARTVSFAAVPSTNGDAGEAVDCP